MKVSNKFVLSAILGAVAFVVLDILHRIVDLVLNPMFNSGMIGSGNTIVAVIFAVTLILTFASIFATILVYYKVVIKKTVAVVKVLLGSMVTALIRGVLSVVRMPHVLKELIVFVVIYIGVLVILALLESSSVKKKKILPNYVNIADIEDVEALRENILNALKPSLKAPLTAVLCEKEQLSISENNGIYNITGNVNSQNSYGAMVSTDFTVQAQRTGDTWMVTKTVLGVKNAVNYAKSFVANYILISIIVTILAAVGFFVMKAVYGF